MSVQFDRLEKLRTAQIGSLWNLYRDRFPETEDHSAIEPVFERFGVPQTEDRTPRFQVLTEHPSPRCWFLSSNGTELIQAQQDRFIKNWRKVDGSETYPRYDAIRSSFRSELDVFLDFVSKNDLGAVVPNQCDVTYVNHVLSGDGWTTHAELEEVVELFRIPDGLDASLRPEDASIKVKIPIKVSGKPIGRLHVTIEPAFRVIDDLPIWPITLVARGAPSEPNVNGVLNFLDIGHEALVRTFAAITTRKMHAIWGRTK